tara:strand:- start:206 stop:850 length:645 start_codon:yes stop_codon:yes gene_type:complete
MLTDFQFFERYFKTCADFTALKAEIDPLKFNKSKELLQLKLNQTVQDYQKLKPQIYLDYETALKSAKVVALESKVGENRPIGEAIMLYEHNLRKMKKSDKKFNATKFVQSITQKHEFPEKRECTKKYMGELREMIMKTPPSEEYKTNTKIQKTKLLEALKTDKKDEIQQYIESFTGGTDVENLLGCEVQWIMRRFGMNPRRAMRPKKRKHKKRD